MKLDKIKTKFLCSVLSDDNECWIWQKGKDRHGYGKINTMGEHMAHRLSHLLFIGPIPEKVSVRQSCKNTSCVNPEHLFTETKGTHNRLDRDSVIKRFNESIIKQDSDCWEWQAFRSPDGYGKFKVLGQNLAHRVSFILHKGPLLNSDMCVLHKCDNPPCVNPDHLFMGTKSDNNKDRAVKGRTVIHNSSKTHCIRGHEFNEKNTYIRKSGNRMCKQCEADKGREKHRKMRGDKLNVSNWGKKTCKRGHEFTEENTYTVKSTGARQCKTCNSLRQKGKL